MSMMAKNGALVRLFLLILVMLQVRCNPMGLEHGGLFWCNLLLPLVAYLKTCTGVPRW